MEQEQMRQQAASPTLGWLIRKYGAGQGGDSQDRLVELCECKDGMADEQSVSDLNELRETWLEEGIEPLTLGDLDEAPASNETEMDLSDAVSERDEEIAGFEEGLWHELTPASSAITRVDANGQSTLTRWLHTSAGAGSSKDVDVPKFPPSVVYLRSPVKSQY